MKDERLYIRISADQKRDLETSADFNATSISNIVINSLEMCGYIRKEGDSDGEAEE